MRDGARRPQGLDGLLDQAAELHDIQGVGRPPPLLSDSIFLTQGLKAVHLCDTGRLSICLAPTIHHDSVSVESQGNLMKSPSPVRSPSVIQSQGSK